jgi:hypothetical protein
LISTAKLVATLPALIAVIAECASSTESFDRDVDGFYVAFEAEVRNEARELGPDGRKQLLDVMPLAESRALRRMS